MPIVKRSSPSVDMMPNVLKVLDLILMGRKCMERNGKKLHDKYSQIAAETCQPQIAKTIAKQCIGLANSSICGHRYAEAAKLLWILCQDRSVFDMFIFRASMIVLENLQADDEDSMFSFISEILNLELINKKEAQLEFLIYGLTHGFADTKGKLEALINMKRTNYLRKNPLLDPIFEGYLMYLKWVELSKKGMEEDSVRRVVDETFLKFKSLLVNPGDWDTFVLKLVELLKQCEKIEEVTELLSMYVESHPDNLNAHIYLSLHLYEYDPNSEQLVYHLEKISEMSPSDERVLILLEKLEILEKKLEKCFMFLDYPSNGKNQRAWSMLLDSLDEAESRNDTKALKTIKTCWSSRQESWYWLYFHPCQVPQLEELQLVESKVKVLNYLDEDHEFIKEVLKRYPTFQVTC